MLKTYLFIIRAIPTEQNHNVLTVPSVEAHFWVRDKSADGALRRARYFLEKKNWIPGEIELQPTLTSAMEYHPTQTEINNFQEAQRFGIAMCIK